MEDEKVKTHAFIGLIILGLVSGCNSARSGTKNSSAMGPEPSRHPWLDTVIGSPRVTESQFDELSWWQQISACISAMFVRGVYDYGADNSEHESRWK